MATLKYWIWLTGRTGMTALRRVLPLSPEEHEQRMETAMRPTRESSGVKEEPSEKEIDKKENIAYIDPMSARELFTGRRTGEFDRAG